MNKETYPVAEKCDHCNKIFPIDEFNYGPDPYDSEVNGVYDKVYLCDYCYTLSNEEI